jgi:hypothetical protein
MKQNDLANPPPPRPGTGTGTAATPGRAQAGAAGGLFAADTVVVAATRKKARAEAARHATDLERILSGKDVDETSIGNAGSETAATSEVVPRSPAPAAEPPVASAAREPEISPADVAGQRRRNTLVRPRHDKAEREEPSNLKGAVAFEIGDKTRHPSHARRGASDGDRKDAPDSEIGHSTAAGNAVPVHVVIIGVDDRGTEAGMVAASGTSPPLRPPAMQRGSGTPALRPKSRADCERRCGPDGFCDPSSELGCGGIFCGRKHDGV